MISRLFFRAVRYLSRLIDGPPVECAVCHHARRSSEAVALAGGWLSCGVTDHLGRDVWICMPCQLRLPS